jgi:hypothetical protein
MRLWLQASVLHSFFVGIEWVSGYGFAMIKNQNEQEDFSRYLVSAERPEFIEIVDDHHVRGDTRIGSWRISEQGRYHALLVSAFNLAQKSGDRE